MDQIVWACSCSKYNTNANTKDGTRFVFLDFQDTNAMSVGLIGLDE